MNLNKLFPCFEIQNFANFLKTYFKPLIIHIQLRKYLSNIKNKKKIFGKIVPMVGGTPTTKLLLGADNIYSEKGVGGQKFWGKC